MSADRQDILEELAEQRRKVDALVAQLKAIGDEERAPRKVRLIKTTIRALPVPVDDPVVYWDNDLTGFCVRISPTGSRTFYLQARTKAGRGVKIKLGRFPVVTPEMARDAAGKHLAAIALGRDPAAELRTARQAEKARRAGATVAELWRSYAETKLPELRPKSQTGYRQWYGNHIAPRLGRTKLADLTSGKIAAMHREITANTGASTANRVHAVISALLSWGETVTDRDHRRFPDCHNVAKGAVGMNKEPGREREMSDVELTRLLAYLDSSPDHEARLIELLLATGARKGEALALRWKDIAGSWWTIPASVSKSKRQVKKPLNAAALDVLGKVARPPGRERTFWNVSEARLTRWWARTCAELKLEDLHIHDLRHCSASLALNAGIPLAAVGKMLGHGVNSASMTARYGHLGDQALAAAADAVSKRLQSLREVEPAGSA